MSILELEHERGWLSKETEMKQKENQAFKGRKYFEKKITMSFDNV